MNHGNYHLESYRHLQSQITHNNWLQGKYSSLVKPPKERSCKNRNCNLTFWVKSFDPQVYCSRSCMAKATNIGKRKSWETRQKISHWIKNNNPSKYKVPTSKVEIICHNNLCKSNFYVLPYLSKRRKYCSNACAMKVIGGQTTSPKASKGKPGIRPDIDSSICFYSTWEANVARVFNLIGLRWEYAPKIFDLGDHTYRPDFYLPAFDIYIEIKNFMNAYSQYRDKTFREKYPTLKLEVILKKEYKEIETEYKPLIEKWEHSR